jgi:hypothetical protein
MARSILAFSLMALSACATAGATFKSGVGDAHLDKPPYYAGARVMAGETRIAHLPVAYQRGAVQAANFEPGDARGSVVGALLDEMNAFLDSLGATTRVAPTAQGTPPDVLFGCWTDASGSCLENGAIQQGASQRSADDPRMRLAVGRPSRDWISSTASTLASIGAGRALVISLELGQYRLTSTGWRNDKSVELGTGYSVKLPWLTSLDAPVQVLQLTGALMEPDGRAVRIGAEGLMARRTGLVASGFGLQVLISDDDVANLRQARREDLPGKPLVWQVALRNLVAELTGKQELALR